MTFAASRDRFAACAAALVGVAIWLQCFRIRGWEAAGARILVLAAGAVALLLLRRLTPSPAAPAESATRRRILIALVSIGLAWNAAAGLIAVKHTILTGEIRMDQGQSTYRAAEGLWHGDDPYARDALLDPYGYLARLDARIAAGVGPQVPDNTVSNALWSYWGNMDRALRAQLLPRAPPGADAAARRETEIMGYKYGPLPVLLTSLLTPLLGPLAVTAENFALVAVLLLLLWRIIGASGLPDDFAQLAFAGVLADHFVNWYYLHFSNSDIWPLAFCALAVLAYLRGWNATLGLALGLALAAKPFPSLLYLPLMVTARSWRAAAICCAVAAALLVPFALWDWPGFANNYLLWSALMLPDETSWISRVPFGVAWALRGLIAAGLVALYLRLMLGWETRLFWTLALTNLATVAAGTVIHNNYVPWFSIWLPLALAEAFAPTPRRGTIALGQAPVAPL